jgi:AcrR family transcriptional regulator
MVTKRRRLTPDARRVEILEAAIDVIRDRGPADTRVEDITDAAGAAKGTFYLYFPSWDDLLVAIRSHIVKTYISDMEKRFEAARTGWWDAFEKECVFFIDFILELGGLHEAVFHGPITDHSVDRPPLAETFIAEVLKEGIASGACRPVDTENAARLIFSVLHETADGIARSGDREQKLDTLMDLLRSWLRTPGQESMEGLVSSPGGDAAIE